MLNIKYIYILFSFAVYSFSYGSKNSVTNGCVGFIANKGQIKNQSGNYIDNVLFKADLKNYTVWITKKGISYQFYQNKEGKTLWNMMDMNLNDAIISLKNSIVSDSSEYYENYIYGDGSVYKTYRYKTILFKNIYPGIDWKLIFDNDYLKQEFIVYPYADKNFIQLDYIASGQLKILNDEIQLSNRLGNFSEGKLVCYEIKSKKKIKSKYKIVSDKKTNYYDQKIVKIEIDKYNHTDTLIIDPILNWRTFFGGSNDDDAHTIHSDGINTYVAGHTLSVNFPSANPGSPAYYQGAFAGGFGDAFLSKFSSNGNLIWSTYFGGSLNDEALSIISNGTNIWLAGYTGSIDFPILNFGGSSFFQASNNGGNDAFISKFNSNGELIWSTYCGGANADYINQISILNNELFVTGTTNSNNFPLLNAGTFFQNYSGGNDAFVMRFDVNNNLVWSTYFGGNLNDLANSIATDNNFIYIGGYTNSNNFQLLNPNTGNFFQNSIAGSYDGFLSKFSLTGNLLWSTYLGGVDFDKINSICIENGNLWITGNGNSTDFPTVNLSGSLYQANNNGFNDIYISKFNVNQSLEWSTYLGGNGDDYSTCINSDGTNVWLSAYTNSTNISTVNPGGGAFVQNNNAGFYDGLILKLDLNSAVEWLSYFGSNSNDYINAIHSDGSRIRVCGYSQSFNLPAANPGGGAFIQPNNAGGLDAFIVSFKNCINPVLIVNSNSPLCVGDTLHLYSNFITNGIYQWIGPNSFTSSQQNPQINNINTSQAGNYTLIVNVPYGCSNATFTNVIVNTLPAISLNNNSPVCSGDTIFLNASGGINYLWTGPENFNSNLQSPFIENSSILNAGFYYITVSNGNCTDTASIYVIVNNLPDVIASANLPICVGETLNLNASGAAIYNWVGPNNFNSAQQNPSLSDITLANAGLYIVYGTDANGCSDSSIVSVIIDNCDNIYELTDLIIHIYPNPTLGTLNLEINNFNFLYNDIALVIYDHTGKIIHNSGITLQKIIIDLNGFDSGTYFLHIRIAERIIYTNRVVLVR